MRDGLGVLEKRRPSSMSDRGMVVGAVSWILVVAMIFTLLTRLAMKLAVANKSHKFGLDDFFIVLAALFSIGQTAAVSIEAMHSLGHHAQSLSSKQLKIFEQAEYAAYLLYIANMGCVRVSVCLLIKKILPGKRAQRTALAFAIFSALWTISGVLVTAFPCTLPRPWEFIGKQCIDLIKFINYVGITNIIVEMILVIIPLFVWNLRLSPGSSISVSCVFLSRLSVVAAVSAQLVFFNRNVRSSDITYAYWSTALCMQIAQNLSIITACLPCLHPFVLSILRGSTEPEVIKCQHTRQLKGYFSRKRRSFDPTNSQSSRCPMKQEQSQYCRPLATYGLDRSSAYLNPQHLSRSPASNDTSSSGETPGPYEQVFMRHVEIPSSPPPPAYPHGQNKSVPKSLTQVGILPLADWETESSDSEHSNDSNKSKERRPDSEYVFNRQKVISVPEAGAFLEHYGPGAGWKRYPPPPKSPTATLREK